MLELGVLDPWRATFPDRRVFSGPNNRNRIDYCLLSPLLYSEFYKGSRYVTETKWLHENHSLVEFHLASPLHPTTRSLPWKCPRWLLNHPIVRHTLVKSLECLSDRIRLFPGCNPGVLVDQHKAADRIFLREMQRSLRTNDDERAAHLRAGLRMAQALDAVSFTESTRTSVAASSGALKAFEDIRASRREKTKFDWDISEGEHGSAYFFRSPVPTAHRVLIPSVTRPDGSSTSEPAAMAESHRHYWVSVP
ncbi:uncharacterized protein CCR75_008535 [Bremia lactucae]|uniref:Uncharacterized protein n=1 Tax=Bremia lactucae TaxID=4779 RepID=A0A976FR32_BRELC|nr:hypothetical protein CCR75_008535 [Bremia lactucae]